MILQPSLQGHKISLSSILSYSKTPHFTATTVRTLSFQKSPRTVTCSTSQVRKNGTNDYERKRATNWNGLFRRISLMEKPELGAASVLNEWEKNGTDLTKYELSRVVKELRKFKRHKQALEVYDWMNNRGERFTVTGSDAAIQLDLIAKVNGNSIAEDYFAKLPDSLKDRRVYGALLNAYARARMKDKAESLMDEMRSKNYVVHHLPLNVMMTLYMNLKEYKKVESIVSEMMQRNISLDIYSYNIWLSSRGLQGSAERMEVVFQQMKLDTSVYPNWTTYSTMATMYIKLGLLDKARDCLKNVESRISSRDRDRKPYHYLISLYGSVGNKDEVYRVWNIYKALFISIPNLGYHAMISSLIRVGDTEGAETIYGEWLAVKSTFDPKLVNVLMAWCVKDGNSEKAVDYFNQMIELGGKPNSTTWEILADGHIAERRISDALSCWKEAFAAEGSTKWKARFASMNAFFKLCNDEDDLKSKEVLLGLLVQFGYNKHKLYSSLNEGVLCGNYKLDETDNKNDVDECEDEESAESLLNQLTAL